MCWIGLLITPIPGLSHNAQPFMAINLTQPAKVLHEKYQVNRISVGAMSDPLDDFYGAMGVAQLTVAASGKVTADAKGLAEFIEVDELGFYLRDTYDFNDAWYQPSQPLGFWGFNGVERDFQVRWDVEIGPKFVEDDPRKVQGYKYEVQNDDFREWRKKNNRGGDFLVFSDVHRVKLAVPVKVPLR